MNKAVRPIVEVVITALSGFGAFIAPIVLDPPAAWPQAPLFPIVREAVENVRPGSFIALAIVGLLAGVLASAHWVLLGLAAVVLFPLCTIAEMIADPTSHNLFPFEFVMYAVFSIPAVVAAGLGRVARTVVLARGRPQA